VAQGELVLELIIAEIDLEIPAFGRPDIIGQCRAKARPDLLNNLSRRKETDSSHKRIAARNGSRHAQMKPSAHLSPRHLFVT
jgi:hypothetical protein